ncbi:winged helix-turn-helix transcriptional regulator [Mediterraneibacter sp. NSJ-55]|uniref:Winged helix-turn-helix transcriptional regulator n=1 Tax=Mediterraneibacter hominis TaxID=2763054 RepID=A0A923LFR3_9FIRM|nr:MarR family winged helix-turn-helix transcriptional regulator [Mediterraneibacter hominis]MBC5687776.1 winged helix-turn-helix transcriptional regulator [Mediterraneibacter hominis]
MDIIYLKKLLDSCFLAKRIIETLPELPKGMKPRHIHVLEAVYELTKEQGGCRVGEVSEKLNITTPSISKLIQELEQLQMIEKYADRQDKRVTLLRLTADGEICVKRHVTDLHTAWADALSDVENKQAEETVHILEKLYATMPKGGEKYGEN